MNQSRLTNRHDTGLIAGILLTLSFLILLVALITLIASGAFTAFSASLRGSLAELAPYATTFRLLNLMWAIAWIVQLMGFGLLTRMLQRDDGGPIPFLAFIAVLVATILGVLHGTFHMSVETWAAQEAARNGVLPAVYEPLRVWVSSFFRLAYILHLAATAGFGWGISRSPGLPSWVGQTAIVWSILWLIGLFFGAGLPGILFLMPTFIGVFLIRRSIQSQGDKIK